MVFYHLGGALASKKYFDLPGLNVPFSFGHSGVAFFFVLSGFIIAYVHWHDVGKKTELTNYLRKRIFRIYPSFLIVFGAVYVMAWCLPTLRDSLPTDWKVIVKSLLLVPQDPALVGGTGAPVLIVAWSLHYEVIFYAIFALAIVSRSLAVAAVIGLIISGFHCEIEFDCSFPRSFLASYWLILFSMGAGAAYLIKRRIGIACPLWVLAFGAVGFFFVGTLEIYGLVNDMKKLHFAYGLCSSLMVLGAVNAENIGLIGWRSPIVDALGNSSYALYLIHYPLISILCKTLIIAGLTGWSGALLSFLVISLLCVSVAHAFHRVVERPVLAWLGRFAT